jgi:energy-coupling factor transport system ATP-binding protein
MNLRAENISFAYPENGRHYALAELEFTLHAGECVALVGPSGAGKSTLAQILNGLLWPSKGFLSCDGQRVQQDAKSLRSLRRRVGLVFQFPEAQIFEPTVRQEVGFAAREWGSPEAEIQPRVEAALAAVGLEPDEFLERNPFKLSGGEDRLITIASLLVVEPDWLILDEPTLGLDFAHSERIKDLIRNRKTNQQGLLLITHDLDIACELCPRVLVLKAGKLAFDGSAADFLSEHILGEEFGLDDPDLVKIWKQMKVLDPALALDDLRYPEKWVSGLPNDKRSALSEALQRLIDQY